MLGRATGVCAGRAGSMNVIDLEHGLIGCFGIIGGSISAATGAALALRRSGGVAVAFFCDGTTNHGYFHECLNFAKVQELPVVFFCENNLYGEFTPSRTSPPVRFARAQRRWASRRSRSTGTTSGRCARLQVRSRAQRAAETAPRSSSR